MLIDRLTFDRDAVQDCLRQWSEEQESLESQWGESLAALEAYQAHLDHWQQELAQERDALQQAHEELQQNSKSKDRLEERLNKVTADLDTARQQIIKLTTDLLARTEELRNLENRQATKAMELNRADANEIEHEEKPDEPQASENEASESPDSVEVQPSNRRPNRPNDQAPLPDNPVLDSVLAQFDKLRQQQAAGRNKQNSSG